MMSHERGLQPSGVTVESAGKGSVRLTLPDGSTTMITIPEEKGGENLVLHTALMVAGLAIKEAFSEEIQGLGQDIGVFVRREEEIADLPGGRESSYKEAIRWACATLASKGLSAKQVADFLISDIEPVKVGLNLGTMSQNKVDDMAIQLRNVLVNYYPGNVA